MHRCFNLFLEHLSVLVKSSLTEVLCTLLHLNYARRIVEALGHDCAILNRDSKVIELLLLLFLQFHLYQSGFVFILRQYYVVPFVLELGNLRIVRRLERLHLRFLQHRKKEFELV